MRRPSRRRRLDNARWCHLVCSTHGITGRFDEDAWVSARRHAADVPRRGHPDRRRVGRGAALAGRPDGGLLDQGQLLGARPDTPPASASSSTLSGSGVRRARHRPRVRCGGSALSKLDDLRAWAIEHGAGSTFSPALLDEPSVTILAARDRDGALMAGAVATEGKDAVGISNVFGVGAEPTFAEAFAGATAAIAERFPDRPIVGYLSTDLLEAAEAAGFETIGPLRVWLLDDEGVATCCSARFEDPLQPGQVRLRRAPRPGRSPRRSSPAGDARSRPPRRRLRRG